MTKSQFLEKTLLKREMTDFLLDISKIFQYNNVFLWCYLQNYSTRSSIRLTDLKYCIPNSHLMKLEIMAHNTNKNIKLIISFLVYSDSTDEVLARLDLDVFN